NILALATAGVTPIMVSDLETDNTTLQLTIATPEEARQAKKVATQNIADTFPKTRELMDMTLKPLMRTNFAKNDPDFYNQFITATQIINTGIHHLDFFGLIMDSVTSEAVGSALVRVLSGTTEIAKTKAGEKGHFRFKEIPEGTYTVEVSRPGYTTQTFTNIVIISGKSTKKTFELIPV
ncbi:MAG: carboxypeptidase regulatory-like domain-containing protein, partial [Bacteroidia bacterium]|nr:carboxypeptidase regulatory-like domain-containing protein [Bacteroidia bacterium]